MDQQRVGFKFAPFCSSLFLLHPKNLLEGELARLKCLSVNVDMYGSLSWTCIPFSLYIGSGSTVALSRIKQLLNMIE